MNMDELIQLGATLFRDSNLSGNAGSKLDANAIISALSGLFGESGKFDMNSLIGSLDASGLSDIARSWLGDGDNVEISPDQISSFFGADKLTEFASNLGISVQEASGGLSDVLPQMVDRASSGGALLDSIDGIEGALGLAGKLFGK